MVKFILIYFLYPDIPYAKFVILTYSQYKNIHEIFYIISFHIKASKFGVYFTLTAHLNSDKLRLNTYSWCLAALLDNSGLGGRSEQSLPHSHPQVLLLRSSCLASPLASTPSALNPPPPPALLPNCPTRHVHLPTYDPVFHRR